MNNFLLTVMLLLASFSVHAQSGQGNGGCPGGMVPGYGKCYAPNDPDRFGSDSQAPTDTGPLWQDRYGAIAVDPTTGSIGWASNARSKREAAKAAIEDCGGGGCEVEAQGRNTCLANAWGGGVGANGAGENLKLAETNALTSCKKGGGSDCKIDYSACSLPVRIR